jgi:hypothetical protein
VSKEIKQCIKTGTSFDFETYSNSQQKRKVGPCYWKGSDMEYAKDIYVAVFKILMKERKEAE